MSSCPMKENVFDVCGISKSRIACSDETTAESWNVRISCMDLMQSFAFVKFYFISREATSNYVLQGDACVCGKPFDPLLRCS